MDEEKNTAEILKKIVDNAAVIESKITELLDNAKVIEKLKKMYDCEQLELCRKLAHEINTLAELAKEREEEVKELIDTKL